MKLNEIKEVAEMIVKDFSGKVRAFIFGSTARLFKEDIDPDERLLDEVFGFSDLDILFEVSPEIFQEYAEECYRVGFTHLGYPQDPLDLYWEYNSLAEKRLRITMKILGIDEHLLEEIPSTLSGKGLDIIFLPFNWEENPEVLSVINFYDPDFSKNIQKDRLLLFEK